MLQSIPLALERQQQLRASRLVFSLSLPLSVFGWLLQRAAVKVNSRLFALDDGIRASDGILMSELRRRGELQFELVAKATRAAANDSTAKHAAHFFCHPFAIRWRALSIRNDEGVSFTRGKIYIFRANYQRFSIIVKSRFWAPLLRTRAVEGFPELLAEMDELITINNRGRLRTSWETMVGSSNAWRNVIRV